jgi:hypothetical protein
MQLIDNFIRVCDEFEKELDAAKVGTELIPTSKLGRLGMEKLQLQKQMKHGR